MSELHRAALALGAVASLMAATSAHALDAASTPAEAVSSETRQAVALVSGGVAAKAAADPTCPKVTLAPDADSRIAGGAKARLDGLARDCANLGAETICKIALVGEGARKKGDGAAAIDAPVTIQIKDAEGRDIETRRVNLKVEMPEGVQTVAFNHVEEGVSLPPAASGGYGGWTIIVGLDQAGADPEQAAAAADEAEQEPVQAVRGVKQKRSRSFRAASVRRARQQAAQQQAPQQPPVVVSARQPPAAPATVTTTTVNGSPMARAAQSFTERRDRQLQEQQARAAAAGQARPRAAGQPQAAQARGPQPAARAAQQSRPAGQPQAAVASQRNAIRTAETTQTN